MTFLNICHCVLDQPLKCGLKYLRLPVKPFKIMNTTVQTYVLKWQTTGPKLSSMVFINSPQDFQFSRLSKPLIL